MQRGEFWWAELPEPVGSMPGYRRPVLIIQANRFNQSGINTIIIATITSNIALADMPGNVPLSPRISGLSKPSVVNVSQLVTADKTMLTEQISTLPLRKIQQIEAGLRLILSL